MASVGRPGAKVGNNCRKDWLEVGGGAVIETGGEQAHRYETYVPKTRKLQKKNCFVTKSTFKWEISSSG